MRYLFHGVWCLAVMLSLHVGSAGVPFPNAREVVQVDAAVAAVEAHIATAAAIPSKVAKPPCPACPKRHKAGHCAAECPPPAGLFDEAAEKFPPGQKVWEVRAFRALVELPSKPELPPPRA